MPFQPPRPLQRCDKETFTIDPEAAEDFTDADLFSRIEPRGKLVVEKNKRWAILEAGAATTTEVYDKLWSTIGDDNRLLSVARFGDATWALLYKHDQGEISENALRQALTTPEPAAYDIKYKSRGGGAARPRGVRPQPHPAAVEKTLLRQRPDTRHNRANSEVSLTRLAPKNPVAVEKTPSRQRPEPPQF